MLIPFILLMEGTKNLVKNLQYVCHKTEEYKYYEFPTFLSKFNYLIYNYMIIYKPLDE